MELGGLLHDNDSLSCCVNNSPSRRKAIAVILFCSVIAAWPLFLPYLYNAHDTLTHLIHLSEFTNAITDGQFPVRWLPNVIGGYGLPEFVFYMPLPFYIGTIFNCLGFSLIGSYKALYILSLPASGIGMFLLADEYYGREAAVTTAVAYMLAPYRFVDIYIRGALNEAISFVFLPLIFLGINLSSEGKKGGIPFLALSVAGLSLSHTNINVFTIPWAMLFIVLKAFQSKRLKGFLFATLGVVFGFLISAFYLLPAMIERSYTSIGQGISNVNPLFDVARNFITLSQLFSPLWQYGYSGQFEAYKMPYQMGTLYALGLVLSLALLRHVKDSNLKRTIFFFLCMTCFSLFMTLNWSQQLWEVIPWIADAAFPWRYLTLSTLGASFLIGSVVRGVKEKPEWCGVIHRGILIGPAAVLVLYLFAEWGSRMSFFYILEIVALCAGALIVTLVSRKKAKAFSLGWTVTVMIIAAALPLSALPLHQALWGKPEFYNLKSLYHVLSPEGIRKRMDIGTLGISFLPSSVRELPSQPPQGRVEIVHGDAELSYPVEKSNRITFTTEAHTETEILVHIFSFPGWKAFINGVETDPVLDPSGRMHFSVSPGKHTFDISFNETRVRATANIISLVSMLTLGLWMTWMFFPGKQKGA